MLELNNGPGVYRSSVSFTASSIIHHLKLNWTKRHCKFHCNSLYWFGVLEYWILVEFGTLVFMWTCAHGQIKQILLVSSESSNSLLRMMRNTRTRGGGGDCAVTVSARRQIDPSEGGSIPHEIRGGNDRETNTCTSLSLCQGGKSGAVPMITPISRRTNTQIKSKILNFNF